MVLNQDSTEKPQAIDCKLLDTNNLLNVTHTHLFFPELPLSPGKKKKKDCSLSLNLFNPQLSIIQHTAHLHLRVKSWLSCNFREQHGSVLYVSSQASSNPAQEPIIPPKHGVCIPDLSLHRCNSQRVNASCQRIRTE